MTTEAVGICTICRGWSSCPRCGGNGSVMLRDWIGECPDCEGSGRCPSCGGSGIDGVPGLKLTPKR